MPASKYELRNGTGTRFVFPEVSVDDIRNNVSGGGGSGGGSTTTTTNTLPGSTGYVRVPCAPCAPCNPDDCATLLADCQAAGNELLEEYNKLVKEYNESVDCLLDKLLPKELNGSSSWSYSASSFRPDYGPQYSPSCTKTITSNIQVEFVSGIQLKFCREDNRNPENCAASGSIDWSISLNKDGSNGIAISWFDTPNGQQSCAIRNSSLNTTYYIFARGINLNENGPPQAYSFMGSFFVSSGGEITRTINTVNQFNEGDPLPCTKDEGPFPVQTSVDGVITSVELTEGSFIISSSNSEQTVSSVFEETGTQTYPTFGGTWSMSGVTVTSSEEWDYIYSSSITFIDN